MIQDLDIHAAELRWCLELTKSLRDEEISLATARRASAAALRDEALAFKEQRHEVALLNAELKTYYRLTADK